MTLEEELKKCLESVSDTYYDFVYGGIASMKTDEHKRAIIDYIKANPKADTSEIIEKMSELRGV